MFFLSKRERKVLDDVSHHSRSSTVFSAFDAICIECVERLSQYDLARFEYSSAFVALFGNEHEPFEKYQQQRRNKQKQNELNHIAYHLIGSIYLFTHNCVGCVCV